MLGLPGYTLHYPLHRGSARVVYRATRTSDGQEVAIKTHVVDHPGPRELAALRHEYSILRDLDLPGVPKAIALEKRTHGLALVMVAYDGELLGELIARGALDLRGSLKIAISLTEILASVHQRGVLHKDIKPHNILVNPERLEVELLDFSIASRLSQETQRATSPDALEGTLAYMSPEQTGRMNRAVDQRSDLYSLGVTLYEVLTGVRPFTTQDPMELLHSHVARRPTPPRERAPELPGVVSDIVMKLLAKAAEDRYQTAAGLGSYLRECLRRLDAAGPIEPFTLG